MTIADCNPFVRFVCIDSKTTNVSQRKVLLDNRVFYIIDGTCTFIVDHKKYFLEKYDLFYLPAGSLFTMIFEGDITIGIICFDFTQNHNNNRNLVLSKDYIDFKKEDVIEKCTFTDWSEFNAPLLLKTLPSFKKPINVLFYTFSNFAGLWTEKCSAKMKNLLCNIIEKHYYDANDYDSRVNEIISYIARHYAEDIDNKSICERIGYHSYYLNNLVKEQTGLTIHQHLINKRLDISKMFLIDTDLTIEQIASLCGYSSPSQFSNTFYKHVGTRPTQYRNKKRNNEISLY